MNPFDLFLLITCAAAAIMGWRKGLVNQLGQLAAIVVALVASRLLGDRASVWIVSVASSEPSAWITAAAYAAVFVLSYVVMLILAHSLTQMLRAVKLGIVNSLGGALFKIAEWLVLVSVCLTLWFAIRPSDREAVIGQGHPFREFTANLAPTLMGEIRALNLDSPRSVINTESEPK